MKKNVFFGFLIILAIFSSCSTGGGGDGSGAWVVDSAWNVVAEFGETSRAADVIDEAEALVADYNATHTDDQYTIVTDEEELDIENAPDAHIVIVYADDNQIYCDYTFERSRLGYERELARSEVKRIKYNSPRGAILYVDNDAPEYVEPYDPPPVNRYEKYTFYILDAAGEIVFEEHITDYYFEDDAACDARLNLMIHHWKSGAPENWVTFIYGYIYTGPPPEDPEDPDPEE
jgi:hypothetical protein